MADARVHLVIRTPGAARTWQEAIADLADEPIALVAAAMYAVHGEDYEPFMAETAVAALAEAGWLRRERGGPS